MSSSGRGILCYFREMGWPAVSSIECPLDATLVAHFAGSDQVAWPARTRTRTGTTDGHFRMAKKSGARIVDLFGDGRSRRRRHFHSVATEVDERGHWRLDSALGARGYPRHSSNSGRDRIFEINSN